MSTVSDIIEKISTRTGLIPKGRNFKVQLTDKLWARFEVTAKYLKVHSTNSLNGVEEFEQTVSLEKSSDYINGYVFCFGMISEDGEIIKNSNQLKRENAMKNSMSKTTKKTSTKKAKAEKPTTSYGLGKTVSKPERTKLIKALQKEHGVPKLTTAIRLLILANWDNDACIDGACRLTDEVDLIPSDINKIRRALRRKGQWK